MKKISTLIFVFSFVCLNTMAQTPQSFKYQTIVRDNSGQILSNKNVSFRISIHDASAAGTVIYQETHNAITNQFGLANINIGAGSASIGSFNGIDWGSGSKFLETELDITGGLNFLSIGTSELLSVPYAFYAEATGDTSIWEKNGTNIYYNKGNVGIGTANPAFGLEIVDTTISGFSDIGFTTKDSHGAIAVYPSTLAAPFEHFADRMSIYSDVFTSSGLDLRADGFSSDIRFYAGGPFDSNERVRIQSDGYTGIGTKSPETQLHVVTSTQYNPSTILYGAKGTLFLSHIGGSMVLGPYGPAIAFSGINTGRRRAAIASVQTSSDPDQVGLAFFTHPSTAASNDEVTQVMVITHGGSVGIGTDTPANGYLLSVKGNVACEEVLVEYSGSWPDYVFDNNYGLPEIHNLESYIQSNKHLPDMPSAKDVEDNGFHLADMQVRLVKKVEELTLYTIEQDKLIRELKQELEKLHKEVSELSLSVKD